jgi:hypothetical protein
VLVLDLPFSFVSSHEIGYYRALNGGSDKCGAILWTQLLVQKLDAAKRIGQPVKAEVRQALKWPRNSESEHLFPSITRNQTVIASMTRRHYGISHPHA